MYIKFEVIKRNAVREFYNKFGGNNQGLIGLGDIAPFLALLEQVHTGQPARKVLETWADYGCRLIDNWDVRMVGKLIELFPSCVPKHWHGKQLIADYNDGGDWIVGLTEPSHAVKSALRYFERHHVEV